MTLRWDGRECWALVLGASSGFGAATAKAWARSGFGIIGVHLDPRASISAANAVRDEVAALGVPVVFHNVNAADDDKRAGVVAAIGELFDERRATGEEPIVGAMLHSLAFGATLPFIGDASGRRELSRKQLEMTVDVMAHSLLYWTRDVHRAGLLGRGSRVYAMTSQGATLAVSTYGAVSAAKAALEAHVRQLALELAPAGITVNAIRAGVTDTPALRRIPGWEHLTAAAAARNPQGRMGRPEDVADALVALATPETHWMTGNVIGVDGGEVMGSREAAEPT
ncbi:MAG: SDR family oxidoreductase [Candidatus Limnocylindrales bacterium]|jgi:NAD(P)-dependent dehydrogenase (short-subunit alcohol dehydrogenase family)